MTPEEFHNNLNRAIDQTANDMIPVMQNAAQNGKALVVRRIQNIGLNRSYSTRPLPIFFFYNKALNAGGRALIERKRKSGEGISSREWRGANGLPVDKVRLTYTGNMFRGWNQLGAERRGLIVRGFVGGSNREVINKLRWNKSRFPEFDRPSPEEKQHIKENIIRPELKKALERNLFGRL